MARPEIKQDRREQILDAFEVCVTRYGIEGATLAKTAETAGLARPLIRHNVGNRDDLVEALVSRYLARSRAAQDELIAGLPRDGRPRVLINRLFDPHFSDTRRVQVASALIAAAADDPALAQKMRDWLDDFVARLEHVIADAYPDASPAQVAAVAAGIIGIYFNVEALNPLGDIRPLVSASKEAALLLIASLEANE